MARFCFAGAGVSWFRLMRPRLRFLFALFAATGLTAPNASAAEEPPPRALAQAVAEQILAEAQAARARSVAVSVAAAPGLERVPALVAAGRALEDRLFADGRLAAAPEGAADLAVELRLSRQSGRIALGGSARTRDGARSNWVLASVAETPEWAPWLEPIAPTVPDAAGFAWRRVGALDTAVLDADGGDLDGDGLAELVALTRTEVLVFRLAGRGAEIAFRTALPPGEPAGVATRAPRGFVRVAPGAGGPGQVLVRLTDERRTRVFMWDPGTGRLEPRGVRDGAVVLASRPTLRGSEVLSANLEPGTNHFDDLPRVRRGASWKTPAAGDGWLDLRAADVTATARLTGAGASYALLDGAGVLRLLGNDLGELSRVEDCGTAFALADWDADGKADALCAAATPRDGGGDALSLSSTNGAVFRTELDGAIAALAAGPQADGETAALVFVRETAAPSSTAIWLLRRRAAP